MRPETCPFALDTFLMCVSPSLSLLCTQYHTQIQTQKKGAFSVLMVSQSHPCVRGFSVVSHRGHSHPDAQTSFSVQAHLPASHTNQSSRLPVSPDEKSICPVYFYGWQFFPPLSPISRYVRKGEAGDEEAQRSGGQAERWDSSQGPWTDSKKRGHRSSKDTKTRCLNEKRLFFFFLCEL